MGLMDVLDENFRIFCDLVSDRTGCRDAIASKQAQEALKMQLTIAT